MALFTMISVEIKYVLAITQTSSSSCTFSFDIASGIETKAFPQLAPSPERLFVPSTYHIAAKALGRGTMR
jgi:hypothetical protein